MSKPHSFGFVAALCLGLIGFVLTNCSDGLPPGPNGVLGNSAGSSGTFSAGTGSGGTAGTPDASAERGGGSCIAAHDKIGCPETYEAALKAAAASCLVSIEPQLLGQCEGLLTYHSGHDGGWDCAYDPSTHALQAERLCMGFGDLACCRSAGMNPLSACGYNYDRSACPTPNGDAGAGGDSASGHR